MQTTAFLKKTTITIAAETALRGDVIGNGKV